MSDCPSCKQPVNSHNEDCCFNLKPRIIEGLKELAECTCTPKYSIEPHEDGYALYWGRCEHKHGVSLALITECRRKDIIEYFEKALNKEI